MSPSDSWKWIRIRNERELEVPAQGRTSENSDFVQRPLKFGRQFVAFVHGQVVRAFFGGEVTPTLKRPAGNSDCPRQSRIHDNAAAPDRVVADAGFKVENGLPDLNFSPDHPVQRSSGQNFRLPPRKHSGDMGRQVRFTPGLGFLGTAALIHREFVNAGNADAQLHEIDESTGHKSNKIPDFRRSFGRSATEGKSDLWKKDSR